MKILILFILTLLPLYGSYAVQPSLAGKWSQIDIDSVDQLKIGKIILKQDGNSINGVLIGKCGSGEVEGVIQGEEIGLNLTIKSTDAQCPAKIHLIGFCNDDCSLIQATWYDDRNLMGETTWAQADKNFYISYPKFGEKFYIDENLKMPTLKFAVTSLYPDAPLEWMLRINFHWKRGGTSSTLPPFISNTKEYMPNIDPWGATGGELKARVIYKLTDKKSKIAIGKYKILGTNPGKKLIEQDMSQALHSKIACVESNYRQFDARSEGGQGYPLIGISPGGEKTGGVGIMQVKHKVVIPATVWNWHENVKEGIKILNEKSSCSTRFHIHERTRLNADRKRLGLPSCPKGIPTPLSEDQLLRDSIRRYNYGVEYRWEPRDGKDCAGNWVVSPSCERHPLYGCDKDYVDKVLRCDANKGSSNAIN